MGYIYNRSKKDWIRERNIRKIENQQINPIPETDLDWLQINQSGAEIHIQKIAEMMYDSMNESTPKLLKAGEWHIPYGDRVPADASKEGWTIDTLLQVAVSRAARISYETLGDNPKIDYEADIKLHDRLLESKHLSCFEHCSRAMSGEEYWDFYKGSLQEQSSIPSEERGWCRNFRGWIQYRHLVE